MKIKQVLTHRSAKRQNYAQPIIYEWEDVISKELNIPVVKYPFIYRVLNRLGIHLPITFLYKDTFRFVINGRDCDQPMDDKHIIPCIIDFFEKEEQLPEFYKKHSKNKLILVSSPFDYHYLKEKKSPIRVELFPYSLPDKYAITNTSIEKKYDIVLTGRQDPLLYNFFKEYVKSHPNVTYVKRGKDIENDEKKTKDYYLNGTENLGPIENREDFMRLQAQGRVTLYGVQGYVKNGYGFHHMTPHFLEIIACECHVILHYPTDARGVDAEFYEFAKFSPSIETYEEFESAMDCALRSDVDKEFYSSYLKKHYTSQRVKQLRALLNDFNKD